MSSILKGSPEMHTGCWSDDQKEAELLQDLHIDRWIILIWILWKLLRPMTRFSGGLF
jgi:hypothetical protein